MDDQQTFGGEREPHGDDDTHEAADEPPSCPHIDRNDARCGTRFSLSRLEQAFRICLGAWHGCPVYHRINRETRDATSAPDRDRCHVQITLDRDALAL